MVNEITHQSRRTFGKHVLTGGTALAFGSSIGTAFGATQQCELATPEEAFAHSFANVPEQYGPTEVQFDRPLPEGLQGTLYRNGPD